MELININCNKSSEETFFINKTSEVNKNENTNKPDTRELDLNNVFINIFKNKNSKNKDGKSSTFNKFFDKILTENNNEYYFLIKVGKIHIPERIQKISAIVFPILLLSLLVYYFTKFYLKSLIVFFYFGSRIYIVNRKILFFNFF